MSGEQQMEWALLWDETEFDFYKTLEDEDKLMYIYDLCLGEFESDFHRFIDDEEDEMNNALDDAIRSMGQSLEDVDSESEEPSFRNEIKVEIGFDKLKIEGPTLDVILKVSSDMMMNGMILMDRNIEFTKYEPWNVILTYNIVGNGLPISLN